MTRLLARLAHHFDDVVPAAELVDAGWPDRPPTANAVRDRPTAREARLWDATTEMLTGAA